MLDAFTTMRQTWLRYHLHCHPKLFSQPWRFFLNEAQMTLGSWSNWVTGSQAEGASPGSIYLRQQEMRKVLSTFRGSCFKRKLQEEVVGNHLCVLPQLHNEWCLQPLPWGWHYHNSSCPLVFSHQWWQWGPWWHLAELHFGWWTVLFYQERRESRGL